MSDPDDTPFIPYGRQWISEEDVDAVTSVLRSDWITTGPKIEEFESAVASRCGAKHAISVNNGTTALHTAYSALGVGPGDEVILPSMTFASTANMAVLCGARPVFADVDEETLLVDPESVKELLSERTKLVVGVDFAGQPFDHLAIREITEDRGIPMASDAAHSLGGSYRGEPVGSLADVTTFSFHPVKPITTGEGGMVVTDIDNVASKCRIFRNHGIDTTFRQRESKSTFEYDVCSLGSNYRLTDIQCALGITQLNRLDEWVSMRNRIADLYDEHLSSLDGIKPLGRREEALNAFHLYVVRVDRDAFGKGRSEVFNYLRECGIGANVHYRPVHTFSYYQREFGTEIGSCPRAEHAYDEILSLPIFPKMDDEDVLRVVETLGECGD